MFLWPGFRYLILAPDTPWAAYQVLKNPAKGGSIYNKKWLIAFVAYLLNTKSWTKMLVWFLVLLGSLRIRQVDGNCIPVLVLYQFRMLLVHFINNQVRTLNIIINLFNIIVSNYKQNIWSFPSEIYLSPLQGNLLMSTPDSTSGKENSF